MRLEVCDVIPFRPPRLEIGIPHTKLERQIGRRLPGVLRVRLHSQTSEQRISRRPALHVVVEIAQRNVRHSHSGSARITRIEECERSVLYSGLVLIVLLGFFERHAELQRMRRVLNPGEAIGQSVDRPAGGSGPCRAIHLREAADDGVGNPVLNSQLSGNEIRIVDSILLTRPRFAVLPNAVIVDPDAHDIFGGAHNKLVDHRGRDSAGKADRGCHVGAVPAAVGAVERPGRRERIVLVIAEVRPAEVDAILIADVIIDADRIPAAVDRMRQSLDPVARPLQESRDRQRIGIQNADAVRAEPVRRDHVVGERRTRIRVGDHAGPPEKRIGGREQLAEVAPPHGRRGYDTGARLILPVNHPLLRSEEE